MGATVNTPFSAITISDGPVVLVTLVGDFDISDADRLNAAFDTVPAGDVTLDLSAVTFCSSTTLTSLLRLRQRVIGRGDHLEVAELSTVMRRLLTITGTHELFLRPTD
jgi:stage II sporulation protein AA (anti-sigma F factor antagonist)